MSRNKKDVFKEIITKAEIQKPADDMADLVMQQITAATDEEVAINPALKKLLQQHAAYAAPMAFTYNVMAQVNPHVVQQTYEPIISKKAWCAITAALLCVVIISALVGSGPGTLSSIGGNTVKQIKALPSVYLITLTLGGLLLVLEHFVTDRLKTRIH